MSALIELRKQLQTELNPVFVPVAAPEGWMDQLDEAFLERLRLQCRPGGESCFNKGSVRMIEKAVRPSEAGFDRWLKEEIELLQKVKDTKQGVSYTYLFGAMREIIPVMCKGRILTLLDTGLLRDRAGALNATRKMAAAYHIDENQARIALDHIPLHSDEEVVRLLGLYRALASQLSENATLQIRRHDAGRKALESENYRYRENISAGLMQRMNGLLSIILGYGSFLSSRSNNEKDQLALKEIVNAAQRGRRLSEEWLTFSGTNPEYPSSCNLHQMIEQIVSLLETEKTLEQPIHLQLDATDATLISRPAVLHEFIMGVIHGVLDDGNTKEAIRISTQNAQFEGQAGIEVFLECHPENDPDRTIGDEEHLLIKQEHLQNLCRRLGGKMKQEKLGEDFIQWQLRLPVAEKEPEEVVIKRVQKNQVASNIWVVDDDEIFLQMVQQVLEDDGHACEGFLNASELQEAWVHQKPDLIILDYSLPDMNGLQCCQWLDAQGANTPVVMVSGLSPNHADVKDATRRKKTYFLQKPFTYRELADMASIAMGETMIGERG